MEKQLNHPPESAPRRIPGAGRVVCACLAAVAAVGCMPKPLGPRIGEAGVEIPSTWQATRAARKGVDSDWLRKTGGAPLSVLVG
jgi:hypothetical protein